MKWNLVAVVAVVGFIYGTVELVRDHGVWKGLAGAAICAVLGILAIEILYPLWFSDRG